MDQFKEIPVIPVSPVQIIVQNTIVQNIAQNAQPAPSNQQPADVEKTHKHVCEICLYKTNDRGNFNKHMKSPKHTKNLEEGLQIPTNFPGDSSEETKTKQ